MGIHKALYSVLFTLLSSGGFSQTTFNNLSECLELGQRNNPSIKIDHLNRELSHERIRSAWSAVLPQVKTFANLDNNLNLPVSVVPAQLFGGREGEYTPLKFGTQYSMSYGAEASLSLINVSNWMNIRSASLSEEAAFHQAKDKELSIREQLITTYYLALLSREGIRLNSDLVKAGDSLVSAAKVRLENGLIEPLEFNRVKSLYLESLQQLTESEATCQKNIHALKVLCGIKDSDTVTLREDIIERTLASSNLNVSTADLPRYKMLYTRTLQSQQDLKKQRAKVLPELSVFARVSRQSFSEKLNFNQSWFDVSVVGLRAEWFLFTGFNRQSSLRQASLQHRITRYDLERDALQSEKELEELKLNHRVATRGLERYIEHHRLNQLSYRIAGEKYTQGIYSIDQYVTIYQEMVRSQNLYLSNLANYLIYESIVQSLNTLK